MTILNASLLSIQDQLVEILSNKPDEELVSTSVLTKMVPIKTNSVMNLTRFKTTGMLNKVHGVPEKIFGEFKDIADDLINRKVYQEIIYEGTDHTYSIPRESVLEAIYFNLKRLYDKFNSDELNDDWVSFILNEINKFEDLFLENILDTTEFKKNYMFLNFRDKHESKNMYKGFLQMKADEVMEGFSDAPVNDLHPYMVNNIGVNILYSEEYDVYLAFSIIDKVYIFLGSYNKDWYDRFTKDVSAWLYQTIVMDCSDPFMLTNGLLVTSRRFKFTSITPLFYPKKNYIDLMLTEIEVNVKTRRPYTIRVELSGKYINETQALVQALYTVTKHKLIKGFITLTTESNINEKVYDLNIGRYIKAWEYFRFHNPCLSVDGSVDLDTARNLSRSSRYRDKVKVESIDVVDSITAKINVQENIESFNLTHHCLTRYIERSLKKERRLKENSLEGLYKMLENNVWKVATQQDKLDNGLPACRNILLISDSTNWVLATKNKSITTLMYKNYYEEPKHSPYISYCD